MCEYINVHLRKEETGENGSIKLIEYNDSFKYSKDTMLSELLNHYAGEDYPVCNEHIRLDRCLHYLIRDNHVVWHVPVNECTIYEYLNCYGDKTITLEMPTNIGGVVEAIVWIFKILDIAETLDWLVGKLKKTSLGQLFKPFQSKNGNYIEQIDLKHFVISRSQWRMSEFMNIIGCYDKKIAEGLLSYFGFEKVEQDLYVLNNDKMIMNQEKFDNYDCRKEALIEKLLKDSHL